MVKELIMKHDEERWKERWPTFEINCLGLGWNIVLNLALFVCIVVVVLLVL